METTQLKITGMSCEACVGHVERSLKGVPGVRQVRVELEANRATVQHDGAREPELIAAVAEAGYEAQPA